MDNDLIFAESSGPAKVINGDEDPDAYTGPPYVVCMKSLKIPHSLMLSCHNQASEDATDRCNP